MKNDEKIEKKILDAGENVIERGQDTIGELTDKAKNIGQNSERYIKDHPLQSVLVAMGVGLIFGKIFSFKSK